MKRLLISTLIAASVFVAPTAQAAFVVPNTNAITDTEAGKNFETDANSLASLVSQGQKLDKEARADRKNDFKSLYSTAKDEVKDRNAERKNEMKSWYATTKADTKEALKDARDTTLDANGGALEGAISTREGQYDAAMEQLDAAVTAVINGEDPNAVAVARQQCLGQVGSGPGALPPVDKLGSKPKAPNYSKDKKKAAKQKADYEKALQAYQKRVDKKETQKQNREDAKEAQTAYDQKLASCGSDQLEDNATEWYNQTKRAYKDSLRADIDLLKSNAAVVKDSARDTYDANLKSSMSALDAERASAEKAIEKIYKSESKFLETTQKKGYKALDKLRA